MASSSFSTNSPRAMSTNRLLSVRSYVQAASSSVHNTETGHISSLMPDAPTPAGPSPLPPRSGGCGATLPSARRSGTSSLDPSPLAGVRRPPWPFSSSSARDRAPCGGPSCCPPLRPVRSPHLTPEALQEEPDQGGCVEEC